MKKAAVKLTFLSAVFLIASATCVPVKDVARHEVAMSGGTPGTPTPGPTAPDGGSSPFPPCGAFVCPSRM